MNDPLIFDENCDARTFNSNLKRIFKDKAGRKVRVRIINSYNFPKCFVEVWLTDIEANGEMPLRLRQLAALETYPKLYGRDLEISCLGNIRENSLCLFPKQWESLWQERLNNPDYEQGLDRLSKTIDGRYYPTLKSFSKGYMAGTDAVNAWLNENPAFGVLKEEDRAIYVADCSDKGEKVN